MSEVPPYEWAEVFREVPRGRSVLHPVYESFFGPYYRQYPVYIERFGKMDQNPASPPTAPVPAPAPAPLPPAVFDPPLPSAAAPPEAAPSAPALVASVEADAADPPVLDDEEIADLGEEELPDPGARPPAPGTFPGLLVHYVPRAGQCRDATVGAPRSDSRINLEMAAPDGSRLPVLAAYDAARAPGTWHAATDDHGGPA